MEIVAAAMLGSIVPHLFQQLDQSVPRDLASTCHSTTVRTAAGIIWP